ncbi:MAG: hypothetical protein Q8K70_02345 [Bacteroidota bacterium]|nr:hypothetical protein [Bacteroidota bacterium]
MKQFILLLLFVLIFQNTQAQYSLCMCNKDSAVPFKQYEFSLTTNMYFKHTLNPPYFNGLMAKKYFKKWILRAGFNINNAKYSKFVETVTWGNSDTGKLRFTDFRIGFEKPLFSGKLFPYVATDLMYSYGFYKGQMANWGGIRGTYESYNYHNKTKMIGIIPAFGIKYRPITSLSIGFEFGSNLSYYQQTKKDLTNQINQNKSGFFGSFFTSGLLKISYHLLK